MSTRYNNGSHYENHQRAAELHDNAAHAHRVAEQQGKLDHLTGQEHSRQALEHSKQAHGRTQAAAAGHGAQGRSAPGTSVYGHDMTAFGHDEIAALAHELWHARGCPDGSPQEDWFHAAEQLRSRSSTS
jgi:hypothetical protein